MLKEIGSFFLEGLKEAGLGFLAAILLLAAVAFVMGPMFFFMHLGDTVHAAWAVGGCAVWFVVLCGIAKKMEWL